MKKWKTKKINGITYYLSKKGWKKSKFQNKKVRNMSNEELDYIRTSSRYDRIKRLYYVDEKINNPKKAKKDKAFFMKTYKDNIVDEIKIEDIL